MTIIVIITITDWFRQTAFDIMRPYNMLKWLSFSSIRDASRCCNMLSFTGSSPVGPPKAVSCCYDVSVLAQVESLGSARPCSRCAVPLSGYVCRCSHWKTTPFTQVNHRWLVFTGLRPSSLMCCYIWLLSVDLTLEDRISESFQVLRFQVARVAGHAWEYPLYYLQHWSPSYTGSKSLYFLSFLRSMVKLQQVEESWPMVVAMLSA